MALNRPGMARTVSGSSRDWSTNAGCAGRPVGVPVFWKRRSIDHLTVSLPLCVPRCGVSAQGPVGSAPSQRLVQRRTVQRGDRVGLQKVKFTGLTQNLQVDPAV